MSKKTSKQILLAAAPFALLFLALYLMFKDSWREIARQLKNAGPAWLLAGLAVSGAYYLADAQGFRLLIRRLLPGFRLREGVEIVAIGLFMNASTFGTGIKPAQALYLKNRGADVGESLGPLMLPYIFHKLTIVLYGLAALALFFLFLAARFGQWLPYLYAGYGLSLAICLVLALLCVSGGFHQWAFGWLRRISRKEKYQSAIARAEEEVRQARRQAAGILRDRRLCLSMLGINFAKFFCWYSVPWLAFRAVGLSSPPISFGQCLAVAAVAQVLIGVIPITGGMVSAEVVFVLLYSVIFGETLAGSAMVIFRLATYYLPIAASCLYSLAIYARERRSGGTRGTRPP